MRHGHPGASDEITRQVLAWPGTNAATGSRGEWSFRVDRREIGHLHGDHVLHAGFPKRVWQELFDAGRIGYHPVFPGKPGFAARDIDSAGDVRDVVALLRLNYERVTAPAGERAAREAVDARRAGAGAGSS